jgi:riboflavin transporter FmnP
VKALTDSVRGMPLLARWVGIGAISAGVTGGIIGFAFGLFFYAPAAPFAAVELGLPATLAGTVVGLVAGTIVMMVRSIMRHWVRSR